MPRAATERDSRATAATNGEVETAPQSTPADSRRALIIHADDAGLCRSVNRATIDAMEQGIVSSASIMVPCPGFEEFAQYAGEHPEKDFGIHLTLNSEFDRFPWGPVSPASEVPGLVDQSGRLWPEPEQTAANARADEVERELTAQIEKALDRGVKITHLDTHMGALLRRPDFLEVYVNLGIRYDVPILFVRDPRLLTGVPPYDGFAEAADGVVRSLAEHRLPLVDGVIMNYSRDSLDRRRAFYLNALRGLKPGVHELIIHCSYNEPEISAFTSSAGLRDRDRLIFMEEETAREIERLGIEIIGWKDFHRSEAAKHESG